MSVKIGHASIDENGKASGGNAGDSTKKEVCVRGWYNGGWHTVLRPKNSNIAEKSAIACENACANDRIGYDQYQRNTLYAKAKAVGFDIAKIIDSCETDCSALMHVCAIAGGANLSYGSNGFTTRNMVSGFYNSGDYEKLTDSKYLTSDQYLKRGDILVKNGHTAMVLENGYKAGASTPAIKPETSNTGEIVYVVKAGDTLSKIAMQYNTTYQELAKYNDISNPNIISVGQSIRIPGDNPVVITPNSNWTPQVGDIVTFSGTKHYASANAIIGLYCKSGKAKITQIYKPESAKHPYHLVRIAGGGSSVYGWCDRDSFSKA